MSRISFKVASIAALFLSLYCNVAYSQESIRSFSQFQQQSNQEQNRSQDEDDSDVDAASISLNPNPQPAIPPTVEIPPQIAVPASSLNQQVLETESLPSTVFGEWMFRGRFAAQNFTGFNPDYLINIGDTIVLKLWGGIEFQAALIVDAQGNIFIPRVGPVHVQNVRNTELNSIVERNVKSVYKSTVGVYANLAGVQPVKVFVSGFARNPGLYSGFSSDSVFHFLDLAGGIDPVSGSFLDVKLLRNDQVVANINVYDFILNGRYNYMQLRDGDTILVGPILNTVKFAGLVENPYQLEFADTVLKLSDGLKVAGVVPNATHARITRNSGQQKNVEYVELAKSSEVVLQSGDKVDVVSDKTIGSIIVHVEGEHLGRAEYVLPYGSDLDDLLKKIVPGPQSDLGNAQLFRQSLIERQKFMIGQSLRALETEVLSARSESVGEATLRVQEAELILQFIDRAEKVEPKGQVVLAQLDERLNVTLEDGDRIRIPKKNNLVTVHGEVYFPSAFLYDESMKPRDYIGKAGGFSQKANKSRVLIMRQSGEVVQHNSSTLFGSDGKVRPGDEILVFAEVDFKSFQFTKDLVEVLYQIAVSAGVLLRI